MNWKGLPTDNEHSGRPSNRYYKLQTLQSALEHQLRTSDKFILASLRAQMGPARIASITFLFVDETKSRFTFKMSAINTKGRRGTAALVVAKNEKEMTSATEADHRNLQSLGSKSRRNILRLLGSGTVFLPDRYRRKSQDREIFLFVQQWLSGYHELAVGRGNQFCIVDAGRKNF